MTQEAESIADVAAAELCSRCKAIDFEDIFSLDPSILELGPTDLLRHGRKVADLDGNPQTWSKSPSSCPLCRLFFAITRKTGSRSDVDAEIEDDKHTFSLWVRSTTELQTHNSLEGEKSTIDAATLPELILHVFQEPVNLLSTAFSDLYLFDQNSLRRSHDRPRRTQSTPTEPNGSGYVDAHVLRSFLNYCCDNHADSAICGTDKRPQGVELTSFRVIDVQALRVVDPGPDPVYTALSYRWGEQAYDPSCEPFDDNGKLRDASALPLVISDALKVTKDLGFRYCWVDRYCIPQNDPRAMEIQFSHMDEIYRLATVTIVAGSSSPFLPGVTRKLKTAAPSVRVGKYNIAAGARQFHDMKYKLRWSPWSDRAWTYQEGLFSRRRLYFTDAGVYYECGRMASGEPGFAAPQPRWNLREEDKAPWLLPTESWEREQKLLGCLETYSKRNLTFERDKLDAALGILHAFQAPGQLIRHYLGTPIVRVKGTRESTGTSPVSDLIDGFLYGMLFYNDPYADSGRCNDLPSWSWTGWTGAVYFYDPKLTRRPISQPSSQTAVHITSELTDGTLLAWDSAENTQRLSTTPLSSLSKFIHIDACTVKIRLQSEGFEESHPVDNPVEPYIINLGTKEVEEAEDKEFPDQEARWKILEIPGRGHIHVEVDIQEYPRRLGAGSENEDLTTGIIIPLSQSDTEWAIILVKPIDDDDSSTMERFGIIRLEPKTVFFRPCLGSRRLPKTEQEQDDLDDYIDSLHGLSVDERSKEVGLPSWEEFLSLLYTSGQAERRCIRLG